MKRPVINVDYTKCTNPLDCRKCVNICEPVTLILSFLDKDFHDPQDWRVIPIFPSLCTNCKLCVENCPQEAISVLY